MLTPFSIKSFTKSTRSKTRASNMACSRELTCKEVEKVLSTWNEHAKAKGKYRDDTVLEPLLCQDGGDGPTLHGLLHPYAMILSHIGPTLRSWELPRLHRLQQMPGSQAKVPLLANGAFAKMLLKGTLGGGEQERWHNYEPTFRQHPKSSHIIIRRKKAHISERMFLLCQGHDSDRSAFGF